MKLSFYWSFIEGSKGVRRLKKDSEELVYGKTCWNIRLPAEPVSCLSYCDLLGYDVASQKTVILRYTNLNAKIEINLDLKLSLKFVLKYLDMVLWLYMNSFNIRYVAAQFL
jgi:hypothetical protein